VFFENQYQLAYVTADLDRATKLLETQFGAPPFRALGGMDPISNTVWTPSGEREITMRAWVTTVGHLTLEVLQPISGACEIFTEMLVPGQPMRLHHIGCRTRDVDQARAESERQGRPVVMAGGFNTARFIYVDARPSLGHFIEYAMASPEYWAQREAGQ
jgi:hypothetical protein